MLSEEQVKQLVSINDSLQVQLADVNAVLNEREEVLEIMKRELADATVLRSELEARLAEIDSIQNRLGEKEQQVLGAEERELELQHELTESARLLVKYNDLAQQYAYLQSQLTDLQFQLSEVNQRNIQLQQIAERVGELESKLENTGMERDELRARLSEFESQKYLREFKL